MNPADNRALFHEIIDELLTKRHVNRPKYFQALELLHGIAKDCSEQCERLQRENSELHQQNVKLAWLANYRVSLTTGIHT